MATAFDQRKNLKKGLIGFQQFRKDFAGEAELHLFGADFGPNGPAQQWAKTQNLDAQVFYHGLVNNHKLVAQLQAFDILLHPSLEESFGNTLIEGMAKGLPVIGGKDSGAVPWVLNEGQNGVLVDVRSAQAIAGGLHRLAGDAAYFEKLSRESLAYAKERFSAQRIAQVYVNLYKTILNPS
ncbi:MAG: glycosyltransferase family 4 protein [Microscillaceae bacterium]|nr:glycosyltransferase family 4 protein [Microscillaceae bacterium]